jgi:S1-C subfamily serine protease
MLYIQPEMMRETFALSRQTSPDLGFVVVPRDDDRLVVQRVIGGWADVIGLRRNDVIVSVAGRTVSSQAQFARLLYNADPTLDRIPVVVLRGGERVVLYVEPLERGFEDYEDRDLAYRGQEAWLGVSLDPRYQDAAVVRRVVPDSPADLAGVRRGDWITSVNGRRVNSPEHLTRLIDGLQPGDEVELDVSRRISGTVVATLQRDESQPRQALRPTYEFDGQPEVEVQTERFFNRPGRGELDADFDRRGLRDRVGPRERGLWDRIDRDEFRD